MRWIAFASSGICLVLSALAGYSDVAEALVIASGFLFVAAVCMVFGRFVLGATKQ